MNDNNKFTEKAGKALNLALESAKELGHGYIGSEHILLGLLREGDGIAAKVLEGKGVTVGKVVALVMELIGSGVPSQISPQDMTPRTKKIIETSFLEARKLGHNYVGTEHILISLLRENDCKAAEILLKLGIDLNSLVSDVINNFGYEQIGSGKGATPSGKKSSKGDNTTPTLNQFGRDLTELATDGKIDPVIGREQEIERIIQILSRRTKNNPCLIGESGVGKTAVAEGLATRISEGNVPESLKGKRLITLDLSGMVAGAKYRGEFEERLKNSVEEIKKSGNVILFIDEMHTIIGAGAAEGAIDAASILKPSLAQGELQVIGATTIDEYRKYVEKDAALERRFQPITVGEPTVEQTIEILKGLRDRYEAHHKVKITDEAIISAVKLSDRYLTDRFLPDKAIDLMDEAASRVRLMTTTTPPNLREIEEKINSLSKEKEEAVQAQDFERAANLRDQEKQLRQKLEDEKKNFNEKTKRSFYTVSENEIADIISIWTSIPLKRLTENESERLLNMEAVLHKRVVGQDEAVSAVSRAIRRGRVGLKDPKRPVGSFLFLGPTGVGKTELSKALAQAMFGDQDATIRIDMSEYMEKHSVSRLIGSPPGYVGFEDGGQLTEKIRRNPYSVLLFDEIEKAHPDVFNILLQILEDGLLTDSHGRKVSFKNAIIILTSNVGARLITEPKKLGFSDEGSKFEDNQDKIKTDVLGELKRTFRPEFLNRIDDIIVFHQLSLDNIKEIAKRMLSEIVIRLETMQINISFADSAITELATAGFDIIYGARPLRRAIQNKIEDLVAGAMLEGKIKSGDNVVCKFLNGKYELKNKQIRLPK